MSKNTKSAVVKGTPALRRFLVEYHSLGDFLGFITQLAGHADEGKAKALNYFAKYPREGTTTDEYLKRIEDIPKTGARAALLFFWDLIRQMMICRGVDNYLCYIAELLSSVYRERPETLRSKEQIRIDFVLKYASMNELISAIADKRVNELSYQSMEALSTFLMAEHGLCLFDDEEKKMRIIEIVETRNLFVHGRGVVNERFISRVPNCKTSIGDILEVPELAEFEMVQALRDNALSIDKAAIEKFNLTSEDFNLESVLPIVP